MTKPQILKQAKKILKEHPDYNGTQMAITIAGDWRGPIYRQVAPVINDLQQKGLL